MDTKLTLKLDKQVIDTAKRYASKHKRSLSRMIETYLKSLTNDNEITDESEISISPFVKSLSTGVQIPLNIDSKKDYSNYLSEKYN